MAENTFTLNLNSKVVVSNERYTELVECEARMKVLKDYVKSGEFLSTDMVLLLLGEKEGITNE